MLLQKLEKWKRMKGVIKNKRGTEDDSQNDTLHCTLDLDGENLIFLYKINPEECPKNLFWNRITVVQFLSVQTADLPRLQCTKIKKGRSLFLQVHLFSTEQRRGWCRDESRDHWLSGFNRAANYCCVKIATMMWSKIAVVLLFTSIHMLEHISMCLMDREKRKKMSLLSLSTKGLLFYALLLSLSFKCEAQSLTSYFWSVYILFHVVPLP